MSVAYHNTVEPDDPSASLIGDSSYRCNYRHLPASQQSHSDKAGLTYGDQSRTKRNPEPIKL